MCLFSGFASADPGYFGHTCLFWQETRLSTWILTAAQTKVSCGSWLNYTELPYVTENDIVDVAI